MAVNKGLKSLNESSPNFSNQALENSINDIKNIDKDDGHQFILSQFLVDEAIRDNTVLTTSQKNDVLESLSAAQPHLQIGSYLNAVIRHSKTIIDGSILPIDTSVQDAQQGTFLECLQLVKSLQSLIPDTLGVPAGAKSRGINDHFGTLNNKFITTEDSSEPVFTRLKKIMQLIDTNSRITSALNLAVANAATANNNLRTFINGLVADSTDFQTSLDNKVDSVGTMFSTLNTRISEIAGDPTTDLIEIREEINSQVSLESNNFATIRAFTDNLVDNSDFTGLAEDASMRDLLANVAQNSNWKAYFENFASRQANQNPIYNISTDTDRSIFINQVLRDRGLPDVLDSVDIDAVANKAKKDERLETKGFDLLNSEQLIEEAIRQLGLDTSGSIYVKSERLLSNLNERDRALIEKELDQNIDNTTLS